MRIFAAFLAILCLAGCNRGSQSKDAVKQGVIEYLQGRQSFNLASMQISVTDVKFDGNKADATVSFAAKGGSPESGMSIQYPLEQKNGKWVVQGRKEVNSGAHAGAVPPADAPAQGAEPAPPSMPNPHGAQMPAPESLPPASKK